MTASPADVAYATYMLRWIDRLDWPALPVAAETLPALRAFWTESIDTDLDAINARLWAWVDANPQAPGDKSMILARMLLCLAAVPNRELQAVGYFEDLLGQYGVPRGQVLTAMPPPPDVAAPARAGAGQPAVGGVHEQRKTQVLWAFAVVSFVSGAYGANAAVAGPATAIELGLVIAMVALIFLWYRIDAEQHGFQRSALMNVSIVMVAAIAVPYYLIRSRGWQHGQIAVLKAVLVFLGSIALSALGGMLFGPPPG